MSDITAEQRSLIERASEIVAAYVAHNHVAMAEVPNLISAVHEALAGLDKPAAVEASAEPLKPAVSVRKSVTDDYIISLEDGRKFKAMKRYLAGLGMTPADYRAKWGLPSDYPMVAPSYAAKRSELARSRGLGRRKAETVKVAPESVPTPEPEPEVAAPAPKRGRARKAA